MKTTITIPSLPPASASKNSRAHWRRQRADARIYRREVTLECLSQYRPGSIPNFNGTLRRLDLTFIFAHKRERDEDNLRGRFKAGQDALVDVGLLFGDSPQYLVTGELKILVDRERAPLTIIEIEDAA